jgi:D-alanine-D-alanine ligase
LEANPNPQIAQDEDFAQSALHVGISYPALIDRLMQFGMAYKPSGIID